MVPEQIVGVDVQLFLKKYDYNIFSHTQRVLDKKLREICLIEVLVSCNSPRVCCERRSSLTLTPRPCIAFPQLLPPDCAMEELAL